MRHWLFETIPITYHMYCDGGGPNRHTALWVDFKRNWGPFKAGQTINKLTVVCLY